MKKFLALIMAVAMLLSCAAFAEEAKNPMEVDRSLENGLEEAWVWTVTEAIDPANKEHEGLPFVKATGEWKLVGAWIGEDFIDDFDIEGVEPGLIAVTPGAITLTITAELDCCANDPTGPLVDVANYWHAHTYCMKGSMVFADYADEEYSITSHWDQWAFVNRGNADGDYNFGPAKVAIKGDDDLLHWTEITGIDYEDQEEVKYIFLNTSGQLVLCYADKNITSNPKNDKTIGFAFIFEKVVPAAE